jgi:CHAD domain-containing protein
MRSHRDVHVNPLRGRAAGADRTLRKRLDPFVRALSGVHIRDAEALHQARVASRRLREVVPLLSLEPDTARDLGRRLRRVTRRLGRLRELDVSMLILDDFRKKGEHAAEALDRVAAALAAEAEHTREWLSEKLPARKLERLTRTLDDIARRINEPSVRSHWRRDAQAWVWAVDARVVRRATRLRAAITDVGAMYSADRLHTVRIALKKLRYAAELSAEARGLTRSADIEALKRAQDTLGRLHDFEVFSEHVRRMRDDAKLSEGIDVRDLDAILSSAELECYQLHAAFKRDREGLRSIADRLGVAPRPRGAVSHRAVNSP